MPSGRVRELLTHGYRDEPPVVGCPGLRLSHTEHSWSIRWSRSFPPGAVAIAYCHLQRNPPSRQFPPGGEVPNYRFRPQQSTQFRYLFDLRADPIYEPVASAAPARWLAIRRLAKLTQARFFSLPDCGLSREYHSGLFCGFQEFASHHLEVVSHHRQSHGCAKAMAIACSSGQ